MAALPPDAVILAAGGSRRMGRTKALLPFEEGTLVGAHVAALGRVARRVIVVVGADGDAVAAAARGAIVVRNPAWASTSQADSLRLGLEGVDGACLVTPVDVAPARPGTLASLALAPAVPVGPDGRDGHPVLLDAALVRRLRREVPAEGLRSWLVGVPRVAVADPDVSLDFDDPDAWASFVASRGG